MIPAIRAELRKLLTVRSTYLIFFGTLALNIVVSYWTSGYKFTQPTGTNYLQSSAMSTITGMGFFVGLVPLLLITHEYRHNLIYYTLTANRRRSTVFLAKLAVIAKYTALFMLANGAGAVLAIVVGLAMGHHTLPAQHYDWWPLLWKSSLYLMCISGFAAIFGFVVRNQIGAFILYLLYPDPIEQLIGLLLRGAAKYLPFNAISAIMSEATQPDRLSAHAGAVVAAAWVVGGLLLSWVLFVKRDAN